MSIFGGLELSSMSGIVILSSSNNAFSSRPDHQLNKNKSHIDYIPLVQGSIQHKALPFSSSIALIRAETRFARTLGFISTL
jgi:hypothetical protein